MANGNGFDEIFAAIASQNEEMISVNAEIVLLSERLKMVEEGEGQDLGSGSAGGGEEEGERIVGAPVCWDDMPPDQRAELWPEFVTWVIWLADRYDVTSDQLPRQCWWKHGSVVEELTALWTSHQSAYAAGEDAGSGPYLWQDALARGIERIGRLWLGTCRNGQHRDRHRTAWGNDPAYLFEIQSFVLSLKIPAVEAAEETEPELGGSDATGAQDEAPSSDPPEDPTIDPTHPYDE